MNLLIDALLSLFALILVGFFMGKAKLINQSFNQTLSKMLIKVVIPVSLFNSAYNQFQDRAALSELKYLALSFFLILSIYIILIPICKLCGVKREEAGIVRAAGTFSNTMFVGLPLVVALLGSEAEMYIVLYFACNTFLFWSMGVQFYDTSKMEFKLSKVIAPPIRGFSLGLLCAIIGIGLPTFAQPAISKISALSTPLAMFYIGAMFYFTDYKTFKFDRSIVITIIVKLFLFPLLTIGFLSLPIFAGAPLLLKQTFCLMACMPTQSQVALVAGERNTYPEYANTLVLITTLVSAVTIPIISYIVLLMH